MNRPPSHTPGPWKRCEAQPDAIVGPHCVESCWFCDGVSFQFVEESTPTPTTYGAHFGGHFVCESVRGPDFELITAAPDLLAELRLIVAGWTRKGRDLTLWEAERLEFAMATIAKAEGRDAS